MKKTYSIVGMKHAGTEQFVASLKPGLAVTLVREPENKFDKRAVAVWCGDKKIGYLPGNQNAEISAKIDAMGKAWTPPARPVAGDGEMAKDASLTVHQSMDATFIRSPSSSYPQIAVEI